MELNSEVIATIVLYMCLSMIVSIIYIFSGSEKFRVDFILKLNETGDLLFSI